MAKTTKKELNELSEADLVEMLKGHGNDVDPDDFTKKELVDKLYELENRDDSEKPVEPKMVKGSRKYKGFSGKMRKIIVAESDKEDEAPYVFVGINGAYEAQIPRGVECVVPEEVAENLTQRAVETHLKKGKDGKEIRKNVPRFPLAMNEPYEG